jgi:uncharacterized RDD family membrane protein YckC
MMQAPGLNNPTTTQKYVLVIAGKPQGPFSIEELKSRKIKPGDFIKTPEMDDYKEAHEVAELRQLFGFKKQPVAAYSTSVVLTSGLLAAVVDWFLMFAVFVLVAFAVMFLLLILFPGDDSKYLRLGIGGAIVALAIPARLIYAVVMESGPKQGTYGKQLLKIRVCDMYGERIDTSRALGRNAAKLVSVLTFFIGYFFIFFSKKQQALHDMLADTVVLKDRLEG